MNWLKRKSDDGNSQDFKDSRVRGLIGAFAEIAYQSKKALKEFDEIEDLNISVAELRGIMSVDYYREMIEMMLNRIKE